MAVTAHVFPNFTQLMAEGDATNNINLNTGVGTVDTCKVALFTGTFNWPGTSDSTANYTTIAQFLANTGTGGGGALTEVVGSGYSRQALTSVNCTTSSTTLVTTLTCASPAWTSSTFSASYAAFYDYTAGGSSDTNGILMCYWDFGGSQSVSGATFTLTVSGSGLVTWTSS